MVCEVVLWCSVCSEVVLWCSACARKQGPWEHFIVIRGPLPPLPPSPLFCMMYKSINGGGRGEVVYAILKFLSQVLNL